VSLSWNRYRQGCRPCPYPPSASATPHVDLAGARSLARLGDELAKRGVALKLADLSADVRAMLCADGLAERIGDIDSVPLADIVAATQGEALRRGLGPAAAPAW